MCKVRHILSTGLFLQKKPVLDLLKYKRIGFFPELAKMSGRKIFNQHCGKINLEWKCSLIKLPHFLKLTYGSVLKGTVLYKKLCEWHSNYTAIYCTTPTFWSAHPYPFYFKNVFEMKHAFCSVR
jgi:hypothetical protein